MLVTSCKMIYKSPKPNPHQSFFPCLTPLTGFLPHPRYCFWPVVSCGLTCSSTSCNLPLYQPSFSPTKKLSPEGSNSCNSFQQKRHGIEHPGVPSALTRQIARLDNRHRIQVRRRLQEMPFLSADLQVARGTDFRNKVHDSHHRIRERQTEQELSRARLHCNQTSVKKRSEHI